MVPSVQFVAAVVLCCAWSVAAAAEPCVARARTDAGWVCGACARAGDYAAFLAVPYAKQPLGELRFQELQPAEPWKGCRDATKMGPICPQRDLFYGQLMRPAEMREDCIHANVYAPLKRLGARGELTRNQTLLPVLVYVHGGGFGFGSGDPDLHGPQYLVRDNVVVITFNYRLGPFGFLSLNSSSVPGNAGLRDMVALLRWVRRNAAAFGGDRDDVTLAGQSAGAATAHLLSLSKAAQGLFKRVILMSGSGIRSFFTTSPAYASYVAQLFLTSLGINGTDSEDTHRQLVATPLHRIMEAHNYLQDVVGLIAFAPVVESPHVGVEIIVDADPEILQAQGRGKDIPFIIGFTNSECQTFRPRLQDIDIMGRIEEAPIIILPPGVIYTTPNEEIGYKIEKVAQKYFGEDQTIEQYISLCTDFFFIYPALKLAQARTAIGGAPVYLYQFEYDADYSVFKEVLKLKYRGAGHSEDLTFIFRANHALADRALSRRDSKMTDFMTTIVTNFMRHSDPTNGGAGWRPVDKRCLRYQTIAVPHFASEEASLSHLETVEFFDNLYS